MFSNLSRFYEAIDRLKPKQPQDKEQAKKLLNEVISRNLEDKSEPERIIHNM
ncbi:MAG: hypothetical protein H7319_02700 [Spirosoma sp.]|nr:hypothetical protein [Spirosoma sp.]